MTTRSDTTPAAYTPDTGAPAPETASMLEDFIDVFYAPSTVFARRQSASAWPYFFIVSIAAGVFAFAGRSVMAAAGDAEFARRSAKMLAENPQLTQEMLDKGRGFSEMMMSVGVYLGMPILLVLVGIVTWLGARIVGAKIDMGRAMLISCIANIPRLVGTLLTAIFALMLSDTSSINGMTRLTYSPARFLDPDTTNAGLLAVLSRFDIFTLWVTLLLGIGVAVIAKVPRSRGYAAAAIAWAVPTLITAIGALFS